MLQIVRSPVSSIARAGDSVPGAVASFLQCPERCLWLVPTARRVRALTRDGFPCADAVLLPRLHTIESFVIQALEHSATPRTPIAAATRLVRLARAWQEIVGRPAGAGLVRQLERFVCDWRACALPVPARPKDIFADLLHRYVAQLKSDRCRDEVASLSLLIDEVSNIDSLVNRLFLNRFTTVVFDGFHQLEPLALDLVAALSRGRNVLLWLVGKPGESSWATVESATDRLRAREDVRVVDHLVPPVASGPQGQLFKCEALDAVTEVETVARQIKAEYLASQATSRPLRLADIAVVLPSAEYDRLVREAFDRHGLAFHIDRPLPLIASRPAQVLLAAVGMLRGQWRHDLLLDFLLHPLVQRRLEQGQHLSELFEHRPRSRQPLSFATWTASWHGHVRRMREKIRRLQSGDEPMPDGVNRDQFIERQVERVGSQERLIASLLQVLEPVAVLDRLLHAPAAKGTMKAVVAAAVELFGVLRMDDWLTPPQGINAVPWVEYQADQQAYHRLQDVLQRLASLPEDRLPLTAQKRFDIAALSLALSSETYEIAVADDAGVQVLPPDALPGLRFRHVYVLGLAEGQVPALPVDGALAPSRARVPALRELRSRCDSGAAFQFGQAVEAAEEKVVLSRPCEDGERVLRPSPYLSAIEQRGAVAELPLPELVGTAREAACLLGRAARSKRASGLVLPDMWPTAGADAPRLQHILDLVTTWQGRSELPYRIVIDAPALLLQIFPDERPFSASDLETYAACPFRYFGLQVLKLKERDPDRTRITYGSLVHNVLERFYIERRRRSAEPTQPLPALTGDEGEEFIALFEREWSALDDGTLPPDLRTLFVHEHGVLRLFLDAVGRIEKEHGNVLTEFALPPAQLGHDAAGRPVWISGRVDRIDTHRTRSTEAVIIDYKTGRPVTGRDLMRKLRDGRMLQLPLYAWSLNQVRPELTVVGGAYVHLSERQAEADRAIVAAGAWLEQTKVPFDVEGTRFQALKMASDLRAGCFPLTSHTTGTHSECTAYCTLRHACRHPDGYQARWSR
ncbi:MAG: PD-(D/E)XK nuclease family protein [Gemmataceae bacterium]|nr:PD-(D/E)XK nuclease family protein [Gemmataceae bacterium]